MVAISLSGSGEGPGWATSRPTLQGLFASSGALRRQAVHGAAWLWLVPDRRRRMGEGSAAGGPWGDGL